MQQITCGLSVSVIAPVNEWAWALPAALLPLKECV